MIWLRTDALVVGAGPASLIFSEKAASQGLNVKIYEEHTKIGIPNHCTGLISVEGFQRLNLTPTKEMIQHKISGCYIHSPNGNRIEVRDKRVRAYAINRILFDQMLANKAVNAGVQLILGEHVDSLLLSKNCVKGVSIKESNVFSPLTIDAEGPSRRLLQKTGLLSKWKKPLLGVNAEISAEVEPEMAEVWFNSDFAPGFFAWVVPLEGSSCRVGLASNSGAILEKLNYFLKKRFNTLPEYKPNIGQVLVDGPLQKTSFNGLLLVGDAAGHVKPTTGGGVVMGGLCASEAAKVAVKAIEESNTSSEYLKSYDYSWKSLYQNEFRSMKMLRSIADRVNDIQIDHTFTLFKEERMDEKLLDLVSAGDMDMQHNVIRKALTDSKVLILLTRILGRLMLDEMLQFVNV